MRKETLFVICVAVTCLYVGDTIGQWRARLSYHAPEIKVPVTYVQLVPREKKGKDALPPATWNGGYVK